MIVSNSNDEPSLTFESLSIDRLFSLKADTHDSLTKIKLLKLHIFRYNSPNNTIKMTL